MNDAGDGAATDSITAPLRHRYFRRIWFASLLSNLGLLIQGVGAAWAMTQMSSSADNVALVQTAILLPVMLFAMPAGAIADMYDRRIVVLVSLGIASTGATALAVSTWFHWVTPNGLLAYCFVVGTGIALMSPAWQSSIGEQVPANAVPSAIALNNISYNIARSVGPAIGGIIVATAGAVAAFALNALLYLPLIVALLLWQRSSVPTSLPPEKIFRAIISGARYIVNSPPIKILLARAMVTGVIGGAITALMPLVARNLLHGTAQTYGLMLSAFGLGAVLGALSVNRLRREMSAEAAMRLSVVSMGAVIVIVALNRDSILTAVALVTAGAAWMSIWALFSIGVQLSAPSWVAGRCLAAYQAAAWGGIAIGSWGWGLVANTAGVEMALLISGLLLMASMAIGFWLRMPFVGGPNDEGDMLDHPEVRLPITMRSGPLIVEIEYRVAKNCSDDFCNIMQQIRLLRQRNGAYGWSIACDIADPESWTERFNCPTWLDYLRQRNRATRAERMLDKQASSFHIGPGPVRVRRMLEGPVDLVGPANIAPANASEEQWAASK